MRTLDSLRVALQSKSQSTALLLLTLPLILILVIGTGITVFVTLSRDPQPAQSQIYTQNTLQAVSALETVLTTSRDDLLMIARQDIDAPFLAHFLQASQGVKNITYKEMAFLPLDRKKPVYFASNGSDYLQIPEDYLADITPSLDSIVQNIPLNTPGVVTLQHLPEFSLPFPTIANPNTRITTHIIRLATWTAANGDKRHGILTVGLDLGSLQTVLSRAMESMPVQPVCSLLVIGNHMYPLCSQSHPLFDKKDKQFMQWMALPDKTTASGRQPSPRTIPQKLASQLFRSNPGEPALFSLKDHLDTDFREEYLAITAALPSTLSHNLGNLPMAICSIYRDENNFISGLRLMDSLLLALICSILLTMAYLFLVSRLIYQESTFFGLSLTTNNQTSDPAQKVGLESNGTFHHYEPAYILSEEDKESHTEDKKSHAHDSDAMKKPPLPDSSDPQAALPEEPKKEVPLSARQKQAMKKILTLKSLNRKDYQAIVGGDLSARTANYDLQDLVKKNILVKVGKGPATRYEVVP